MTVGTGLWRALFTPTTRPPHTHTSHGSKIVRRLRTPCPLSPSHACSLLCRKSLKVVELKDILSKAQVALQGKANKPDLIAKILASPAALEIYEQHHSGSPAKDASQTVTPSASAEEQVSVSNDHHPTQNAKLMNTYSRPKATGQNFIYVCHLSLLMPPQFHSTREGRASRNQGGTCLGRASCQSSFYFTCQDSQSPVIFVNWSTSDVYHWYGVSGDCCTGRSSTSRRR